MTLETHLRQAATVLLECAIRIAPPETRDWGQAMRSELNHVEGTWALVMWALGGASVLAKRALAALLMPGRRQEVPPGAGLFAKDVSVRKAALITAAGCVLAALLFFVAPPFRQGLRVAISPWTRIFLNSSDDQRGLMALARRAEQQRDGEGLVFCAVRLKNDAASARLARAAVSLDPNLVWVYAVVAVRHPGLPEINQWLSQLERWDPQNALFPLITAESIHIRHVNREHFGTRGEERDSEWRSVMTAAFQSPKFDDYLDRVEELDRRVVPRYRFYDPEEVLFEEEDGLPNYAAGDSLQFASSLIQSGQELEARGDRKGAGDKYWAVAHFGQMIDSEGHTSSEHWVGTGLQAMAYKQFQALSRKEGNQAEAALFSYLTAKFDEVSVEHEKLGAWIFGWDICKRNASVLLVAGLMMLIFSGLLVVAASILIAGSRRRAGRPDQAAKPADTLVAPLLAMISAVGLLLSSSALYLTYRPYWYIFQSAILTGDRTQAQDLRAYLSSIQMVFGLHLDLSPDQRFAFWAGVILFGVIGLVLILRRDLRGGARANGLEDSPRVP